MGVIGRLIGLVAGIIVGKIGASYVIGMLNIQLPCFYKTLFFCLVGPDLIIVLIVAIFISSITNKIIPV